METESKTIAKFDKNRKAKYLKIAIIIIVLLILILCDYVFIVRKNKVSAPTSKNPAVMEGLGYWL